MGLHGRSVLLASASIVALGCSAELSDKDGGSSGNGNHQNSGGASNGTYLASESVARRLTRAELDHTVSDVLGDTTAPANTFMAEDQFTPYDNDYTLQHASAALIDSYEALATDVAARAVLPENRSKIVPCTPTGADDAGCFRQVIELVGKRLFRAPLTEERIGRYLTLQAFATEDNPAVENDFYTAVNLFLRSVLQDPEFLYRIEVGTPTSTDGVSTLTSYELASRISFLLWGSTPDDALLSAADADELVNADARIAQVTRLLGDPRAKDQVHRFHAMWLGYRAIPHPPDLVAAFNLETTKLIDRVVFDSPGDYLDVFRLPETYLTDFLADHYGLPHPDGGEGWVSYGDTGRAGILSHGSVLAAFSKFSDTSPTQRGILVRTRLMCDTIPPPPANVDVDQPPGKGSDLCKLDRYDEHRSIASCAGCHDQMDPIGYGLENYDVAGRYRTHDDGKPECVLPGTGELPGYGSFAGPAELANKLIEANVLDACLVRQLTSFAVGRHLTQDEDAKVATLTDTFRSEGRSFQSLLLDYVSDDSFVLRREPQQ